MQVLHTNTLMICEDHPHFNEYVKKTGFPVKKASRLDYVRRVLCGPLSSFNDEKAYGTYLYQQAEAALRLAARRQRLSTYDQEALRVCRYVLSHRRWYLGKKLQA